MEVKAGVGYTGKEARYSSGKSKRLKEKFTFVGTGKDFMRKLSLLAEERFSLSKVKRSSSEEMEIPGSPPGSKITFLLPLIFSVSTTFTKSLKNP